MGRSMAEHSSRTRHWRGVACALLLSLLAPAGAETSMLVASNGPEWKLLLDIQARVPGFAGFVLQPQQNGHSRAVPLLVFPNLAAQAAVAVRETFNLPALPVAIPARYSARTLVEAVRRIAAKQPSAQPVVDFGLNRVVVDSPRSYLDELAREWGVPRALLVAREEKPQFEEKLLVRGQITAGKPLEGLLRVQVRNTLDRPAAFAYGCSGFLPLRVLTSRGQPLPEEPGESIPICTDELMLIVLQPGEAREFPGLALRVKAPPAGKYLLKTERGAFLPLTIWPR